MGIQIKVKAYVGNPKYTSISFLYSLIHDEDVNIIYVAYDPLVIDIYEEFLYEWLSGHNISRLFYYILVDKNVCNSLVVYWSK